MKHSVKKLLLFSLICTSLIGCSSNSNKYEITEEDKAIDEILNTYAAWVKRQYNICPISTTVGMPNGVLKLMGVGFQAYRLLSKQEAREIIVNSSQKLLFMINSEPRLQDFLVVNPFTVKNISMVIFISDTHENEISDPIVSIIGFDDGYLDYQTVNHTDDIPSIASSVRESYQEAVEALQMNQKKISDSRGID